MTYRWVTALFCVGLLVSSAAYSGEDGHKHHEHHAKHAEHEQHAAHVHGKARLLVAVDGEELAIELYSPAMNLVGFEHKPNTEAQKHAIQDTVATLQKPAGLFGLSAEAGCVSNEIEVDAPYTNDSATGHEHNDGETHSEFAAHYHFNCQNTAMLKQIEVNLIQKFSAIEAIEVQLIAPSGQRKLKLTAAKRHIDL